MTVDKSLLAVEEVTPLVNGIKKDVITKKGVVNGQEPPQYRSFFNHASSSYAKSASNVTNSVIENMIEAYCTQRDGHPINASSTILDNACGPGTVTKTLLEITAPRHHPRSIHAADISPQMIQAFDKKSPAFPAHPDVSMMSHTIDAQSLNKVFFPNTFTHIFMTFAIYSLPDPSRGLAEMYRILRPGGICFITSWVEMGFMTWYAQAQASVRPDLPPFTGLAPIYWRDAENVRAEMLKGGFSADKIRVVPFHYGVPSRHFPDRNIMKGMIDMITKDWSEDKDRFVEKLEEILAEKERVDWEVHGGMEEVPMVALIGIGEKDVTEEEQDV